MKSLAEIVDQLWREARGNIIGGLAVALILALLGVNYSVPSFWGSIVAIVVFTILLGVLWVFLSRWTKHSKRQPSASLYLKTQLEKLVNELRNAPLADAIEIERMIIRSFDGREQLLRPAGLYFHSVLSSAKKSRNILPQVAILQATNSYLAGMDKAHEIIAEIGSTMLENIDGGLVDSIVLADFSTPISKILRRLAERYPQHLGSVQVHLIASGLHFISSQDTIRWKKLLNQKGVAQFYHLEDPVMFSKCESLFKQLQEKGGNIILLGAERVYPEGTAVVFPGVGVVAKIARDYNLPVFIVAETYKVQPKQANEKHGIGSDIEGAPIELAYVEMSAHTRLITEHGIHSMDENDTSQTVHTVKNLKCCTRFWQNSVEGRNYPLGIIFDLDGTLIDSESLHKHLYQKVSESVGYRLSDEEYRSRLCGRTDTEVFDYILQRVSGVHRVEDLVAQKQQEFLEHIKKDENIRPIRGAVQFLNNLAEQGFLLAVATSATSEEANLCLSRLRIIDKIAVIRSAESIVAGKPAPEIYQKTARDLGLLPSECLVYEDSISGIQSANAAGMRVVAVGDTEDQSLRKSGALLVIRDFDNHNLPEISSIPHF